MRPVAVLWISLVASSAYADGANGIWIESSEPLEVQAALVEMGENPGDWRILDASALETELEESESRASIRVAFAEYQAANNIGCLDALNEGSLGTLEDLGGPPEQVAQAMLLRAACSFGAQELGEANQLLRILVTTELPTADAREGISPDLLAELDALEEEAARAPRLELVLEGAPAHARVAVDGRPACERLPCTLSLRRGEHALVVRALGHVDQTLPLQLRESTSLALASPVAPEPEVMAQLRRIPPRPRDQVWVGALSRAYGLDQVIVLTRSSGRWEAQLHEDGAIVRRGQGEELADALEGALRVVVPPMDDLAPEEEPSPLRRNPWLWTGIGAVVIAAILIPVLLTRPPQRDILLFPEDR